MSQIPCLLCRQSSEIKAHMIEMGLASSQYKDIMTWLKTQGIIASYQQVAYFLRKNGCRKRFESTPAPPDPEERVRIYITRLIRYKFRTYHIKNLRLAGGGWNGVTAGLTRDGMIKSLGGRPRHRWKVLASDDELQEWMDKEVGNI